MARTQLIERLHQLHPLTLVVAPAGYGKTTLLSKWLDDSPLPSTWLSLDERDDGFLPFLAYFLAAIRKLFPDSCSLTLALAFGAEVPNPSLLAATLINELDSVAAPFILVLDDYQFVTEPAAHQFVAELLRHPSRTLHLVLSTRFDPPLPLAVYRARDQLTELRTHDLRFSEDETSRFLHHALKAAPDREIVAILRTKTEGWIAGMRLAVLYLRTEPEHATALANLQGNSRYTMDYLAAEVLSNQPAAVQEFLIKTSFLDRLCAPLCEAVVGPSLTAAAAQGYLERLEQQNLFVFPLDEATAWFRYHHLLQQLLRYRLQQTSSPDELANLHARAAAWFDAHGLVEEAIIHALKSNDSDAAIRILEAHRHEAMNQEQWQQLELWLRLFPPNLADTRPELAILEAWLMHGRHQMAAIPHQLDRAVLLMNSVALPETLRSHLTSEIDALRSQQFYRAMDAEGAYTTAMRALATAPLSYSMVRGIAYLFAAGGLQLRGDIEGALHLLAAGEREDSFARGPFACRLLVAYCFLYWMLADLMQLEQTASRLLQLAIAGNLQDSIAWAYFFRGCGRYQQNDLTGASSDFTASVAQRYSAHGYTFAQGAFGLAATFQAQGLPDRAREVAEMMLGYAQATNNAAIRIEAQAFQAHLALARGELELAYTWAARFDRSYQGPLLVFFVARIAHVRVLVHQNTTASRQLARRLLDDLDADITRMRNTRCLIDVLALRSLLVAEEGDETTALRLLEQALGLARPTDVVRALADLCPDLDPLLTKLAQADVAPEFIARIQAASRSAPSPDLPQIPLDETHAPARRGPFPAELRHADLLEMLTYREMDVLLLLEQRYSNKEIAHQLGITTDTVKQHTINLFRKLHVDNRRQAVVQARALGVLPAT